MTKSSNISALGRARHRSPRQPVESSQAGNHAAQKAKTANAISIGGSKRLAGGCHRELAKVNEQVATFTVDAERQLSEGRAVDDRSREELTMTVRMLQEELTAAGVSLDTRIGIGIDSVSSGVEDVARRLEVSAGHQASQADMQHEETLNELRAVAAETRKQSDDNAATARKRMADLAKSLAETQQLLSDRSRRMKWLAYAVITLLTLAIVESTIVAVVVR